MAEISPPAFHVTTTRKFSVEVNDETALGLERYKAFYKQAYGADVPEADLVREMARRFMEADREFQAFRGGHKARSRSARRPAPTPTQGAAQ